MSTPQVVTGNSTSGWEKIPESFNISSNNETQCATNHYILDNVEPYCIMFITIFGILGNCLSATVFMRKPLSTRNSSYYLCALAISDTCFLLDLFYVTFTSLLGVNSYNLHFQCLFHPYLSSVFTSLSAWIIVSFTVERFIAVQYPFLRPHMCTVRRAKFVILFNSILALVFNLVHLFTNGINKDGECDVLYYEVYNIYMIVDAVVSLITPAILIVVMNVMIAIRLTTFSHIYKTQPFRMTNFISSLSMSNTNSNTSVTSTFSKANKSQDNSFVSKSSVDNRQKKQASGRRHTSLPNKRRHNVTKLLLTVSTVFIALNLPSYFIRLFFNWKECDILQVVHRYSMLFFYTNFSINFLLYSTCGISFRRALMGLGRRNISFILTPNSKCKLNRISKLASPRISNTQK